MVQSSLDDGENVDSDLPSNLVESTVDNDSDDEEGFIESTEVRKRANIIYYELIYNQSEDGESFDESTEVRTQWNIMN